MTCILNYHDKKKPTLECTVCGATVPLKLPIDVRQVGLTARDFQLSHATCARKERVSRWKET